MEGYRTETVYICMDDPRYPYNDEYKNIEFSVKVVLKYWEERLPSDQPLYDSGYDLEEYELEEAMHDHAESLYDYLCDNDLIEDIIERNL